MLTIQAKDAHAAVSSILWAHDPRSRVPILAQAKLVAAGDVLSVRVTDLDNDATVHVATAGAGAIACLVNAKAFADALKRQVEVIELRLETDVLKVGNAILPINHPIEDFPETSERANKAPVAVWETDMATLRDIWRSVGFAVSTEETRYYLCGVYLHNGTAGMTAVATDGHRLAVLDSMPAVAYWPASIIPTALFAGILKCASVKENPAVAISRHPDALVTVKIGVTKTVVGKLVDGSFPDYERVIPQIDAPFAVYSGADLAAVLAMVKIGKNAENCRIEIETTGTTTLTTSSPELGTASAQVACGRGAGMKSPLVIGFNRRYMAEMMEALGDGNVTLFCDGNPKNAVLWRGEKPNYRVVLMPMRL